MTQVRIHKLISRSGLTSLRRAEELVRRGRVEVDGRTARIGQLVDPEVSRVQVDDLPLPVKPDAVYILLNKPRGVVSTVRDDRGRQTVIDLVDGPGGIHPIGRLDMDSEGLIILTNDGELTNLVTHPRYGITKTYVVRVAGRVDRKTRDRLLHGVELEDGIARARSVEVLGRRPLEALLEIVMMEGRKREVRRMCDVVGLRVLVLFRSAIGPIRDPRLRSGEHRLLAMGEVRALYEEAGGSQER